VGKEAVDSLLKNAEGHGCGSRVGVEGSQMQQGGGGILVTGLKKRAEIILSIGTRTRTVQKRKHSWFLIKAARWWCDLHYANKYEGSVHPD
jgi:hypothetical protein